MNNTYPILAHLLYTASYGLNKCPLKWRHNERDSVSSHQLHNCLLKRLFRHIWKKTSKLRGTGLCEGDRWIPRTKGPETLKLFPFDVVIVAPILLMTLSDAFSLMKIIILYFKFHWNLYLRVQLIMRRLLFRYFSWTDAEHDDRSYIAMMTSSIVNIFRVTDPWCGEFTGHWWIPLTKASDADLWYFLWSEPE